MAERLCLYPLLCSKQLTIHCPHLFTPSLSLGSTCSTSVSLSYSCAHTHTPMNSFDMYKYCVYLLFYLLYYYYFFYFSVVRLKWSLLLTALISSNTRWQQRLWFMLNHGSEGQGKQKAKTTSASQHWQWPWLWHYWVKNRPPVMQFY